MRKHLGAFFLAVGLFAAESPPIKVALYDDKGATGKGIPAVEAIFGQVPDIRLTHLKGADIAAGGLRGHDLVMFTGGGANSEAEGLGEVGRAQVRDFVREGGGYVGICAGAYLACSGFKWGVGVRTPGPSLPSGGEVKVTSRSAGKPSG